MSDYGDDLYGGMFDLDGDGKTDFFEEMVAIEFFEEEEKRMRKMREDNPQDWYERKKRRSYQRAKVNDEPIRMTIPGYLDHSRYKGLRRENVANLVIVILSALLVYGIVGGGIYLVLSGFGFKLFPLIICGVVGVMAVLVALDTIRKQLTVYREQRERLNEVYQQSRDTGDSDL